MTATPLKDPTYENVYVGEEFGPLELATDEYFLRSYAYALDDYTGMVVEDGKLRPLDFVPPHVIAAELSQIFCNTVYDRDKVVGLHQKEEVEHHKAVKPGTKLTLTGTYTGKYMKRGKGYTVLESIARDEDGDVVVVQRSTEVMRIPDGIKVGTSSAEPERRVSARELSGERVSVIGKDTPVDTPLVATEKCIRQAQMSVFTGAEVHKQGIHTSREIAHKAGLKDCLAQGMMESCWVSQYLYQRFGSSFLKTGKHFVTYLNPVYARDVITIEGVVTENVETSDGRKVEVEIWLTNQRGETTAVGYGSAIL